MYAQYRRQGDATPAIPQNYSGNAFRYPPPTTIPPPTGTGREVSEQERVSVEEHEDVSEQLMREESGCRECEEEKERPPEKDKRDYLHLPSILPDGIGGEELLLLALIFLLSGEGGERNDLPLYLLLLLFCG